MVAMSHILYSMIMSRHHGFGVVFKASTPESCKAIANFAKLGIPNGRGTPDFLLYDGGPVFKMDVTTLGSILTNREGNVRYIFWQGAAWP
jgi:hypothetical protein